MRKIGNLNRSYESILLPQVTSENKKPFFADIEGFEFEKLGFCKEFGILSSRTMKSFVRNPRIFKTRVIQTFFIIFWALCLYTSHEEDPVKLLQMNIGLFTFLAINQVGGALTSTLYPIILERPVFL